MGRWRPIAPLAKRALAAGPWNPSCDLLDCCDIVINKFNYNIFDFLMEKKQTMISSKQPRNKRRELNETAQGFNKVKA